MASPSCCPFFSALRQNFPGRSVIQAYAALPRRVLQLFMSLRGRSPLFSEAL
jgi:hypothetical protein